METRANYATIGVFTLAVIVACFAFVYWLARYDESGTRKPLRILIPGSVTGLANGSQVLFNGIRIGDVTTLRINPQDPNQVEAMVSVDPNQPIKSDTKATVGVQGLTGIASIELRGGTATLPSIFDETEIPTLVASGSGLSEILNSAQDLLNKANVTVDRLNVILDDAQPSVKTTLANVEKFTGALAQNSDGINDFLANVSALSKQVGALSGDLQGLVGKADKILAAVDPSKIADAINQIDKVVAKLAQSADTFPQIVSNVKDVSEQLGQTLASARQIIDAVQVEAVKSTIQDVATVARRIQGATVDVDKIVADASAAVSDARDFVAFARKQQPQVEEIVGSTNQLMGRLNDASEKLDSILGGADAIVNDPDSKNFFKEAAAAAASIRKVADAFAGRADAISANIANFTGSGLRNIDQLVNQLQRTTTQFNRTLNSVQSNPQGFVFGNPTVKEYNRK